MALRSRDLSNLLAFQDVRVLYNQMAGREVDEPDAPIETSLNQILAYIRSHWEKVTEKNRAETDCYLDRKVRRPTCTGVPRCSCVSERCPLQEAQCVSSRLSPGEEQLEALKAECSETGCRIQSLQAEIESIRALVRPPSPDRLLTFT